jgi:hypothetical protein
LDGQPEKKVLERSEKFTNPHKIPDERIWHYSASHTKATEQAGMKSSGWNFNTEFAPSVNAMGVGGSLGKISGGYDCRNEERTSTSETKNVGKKYEKKFEIPAESSMIVEHLQITKRFKCKVENIIVSFKPKTKITCKVQKIDDTSRKTRDKKYELKDACYLNNEVIPSTHNHDTVTCTVSACYEWKEIHTDIRTKLVPVSD